MVSLRAKNYLSEVQRRIIWLTIFAIAMAHVEAALVVYLRSIYYPGDPLSIFPLSMLSQRDLDIEFARELATMVMLLSVALLAETGFTRIFAAFLYAFGVWDIFYYLWLKTMIGWPVTWLEWDVLFLIPWPWFAPWITAALMALLFVTWGGWILLSTTTVRINFLSGSLLALGISLVLGAFLWTAAPLVAEGDQAFHGFQPDRFSWGVYVIGYCLTTAALLSLARSNRLH